MSDKQESSLFTHEPLPYIVILRIAHDEDKIPEIREFKIIAYSVMEALFQALFQAGGTEIDGVKYKVESIQPDVIEYLKMRLGIKK